jgi:peptidoglycan/LPS O-acetylase OafA/YrhL
VTYDDYCTRRYIPAFDALRAVSVMLVITVHVHFGNWVWLGGVNGVTIFFVLSGYLITFLALKEERINGKLNATAFYVRRTFRIFPMYYVTVVIYALLILVLRVAPEKIDNFVASLPYYLTYFSEVPFFFGVNGARSNIALYHSWSLGIEEKFYVLWPPLIFLLLSKYRLLRFPTCFFIAIGSAAAPRVFSFGAMFFPYFHILVGCGIAILLADVRVFDRVRFLGHPYFVAMAGLLLLALHLASPYYSYFPFDQNIDIAYGLGTGLFLATIVLSGELTDPIFGRSILLIGRLSYGIYLLHVLCINAVEVLIRKLAFPIPQVLLGVASILGAALLATATAWIASILIERPLIKIGHRISARRIAFDQASSEFPNRRF